MPTTIDNETELSAVNSILASIGQSPIDTLDYSNPEIDFIYKLLREANIDTQNEGWEFNTERHVTTTKDAYDRFPIATNVLRYDVTDGQIYRTYDVIRKYKDGIPYLYDKVNHKFEFTSVDTLDLDVVLAVPFEELPSVFQRYITYRASVRAAIQLVSNPQLVELLRVQEAQARANCIEYECNQGDHSFMGWEAETSYNAFQPYKSLRRH